MIVASQHIARGYVSRCMSLVLVGGQIPSTHDWMVLDLQTSVRCLGNVFVLNLAFFLGSVLTDPGTSGFSCLCSSRLPDSGTFGF
jgi:hypothetical protein